MALTLTIAGVDRSGLAEQASYSVKTRFGRAGATATIVLRDEHLTAASAVVIKPLDTVVLTDTALGRTLFGGIVTDPKLRVLGPNLNEWSLDCKDYTYLADAAVVSGTFTSMAADEIIDSLVAQADKGLTTANVMGGPILSQVVVNFLSLSRAIDLVSRLATGVTGKIYGWYVDENADIHWFNASDQAPSGVAFTDAPTGAATTALGFYGRNWAYEWDANTIRNRVVVRGGSLVRQWTDHFTTDGKMANWPLSYIVDSSNAEILALMIGGVAQTVAFDEPGVSTAYRLYQTAQRQWFLGTNLAIYAGGGGTVTYTPSTLTDSNQSWAPHALIGMIVTVQNPSGAVTALVTENTATQLTISGVWPGGTPLDGTAFTVGTNVPAAGQEVAVTYQYRVPVYAQVNDQTSQAAFAALPNKGIFDSYISDMQLTDLLAAKSRASREIAEYGEPMEKMKLKVTEDFPGHVRAGDIVNVSSAFVPDSAAAYAIGISAKPFVITDCSMQGRPGNYRTYDLTLVRVG